MRAMRIVFYVSGHGLGHASRAIELMHALVEAAADARIVVRTSAPAWMFERTAPASIELQSVEADTGIVQIDSVRIDEAETVRRAASAFSRIPPTGRTRPLNVISPVIATSSFTGSRRSADRIAVAMVTPADGPSFGIAPAGT